MLGEVVKGGFHNDVMQALTHINEVSSAQLKRILCDRGQMTELDAGKIIGMLQSNGKVETKKLDQSF